MSIRNRKVSVEVTYRGSETLNAKHLLRHYPGKREIKQLKGARKKPSDLLIRKLPLNVAHNHLLTASSGVLMLLILRREGTHSFHSPSVINFMSL